MARLVSGLQETMQGMDAWACELKEQTARPVRPESTKCYRDEPDERDVLSIEWAGIRPALSHRYTTTPHNPFVESKVLGEI